MDHRTSDMLDSLADLFLTGTHAPKAKPKADDALEGPPPIRLSPKLRAPQRVPSTPHLRMTHEGEVSQSNAGMHMELVFLGNLPGFAGPWLTQYAQWHAGESGAVGVLRLDDEQVDIELVGRCDDPPHLDPNRTDLKTVIKALHGVKRWLICPGDAAATLMLPHFETITDWTILCGSNDPAVLGAAQLVRQLLEADAITGAGAPDRQVSLMVMGAESTDADHTVTRVNAALDGLVSQPVELRGSLKQMGPVHVRMLRTCPVPQGGWSELIETLQDSEVGPTPAPASRTTPSPRPVESAPKEPSPQTAPASSATPIAAEEPDLSQFLSGALSLQARCPKHPQTQLVLDQEGRLHLLRRHAGRPEDLYAAVIDLIEARRWVAEHLQLLQLTQRQCTFDEAAAPVLHLFTDQGKVAAALTGRLGAFVQLHLLQRVQAGGASTWFCADLN